MPLTKVKIEILKALNEKPQTWAEIKLSSETLKNTSDSIFEIELLYLTDNNYATKLKDKYYIKDAGKWELTNLRIIKEGDTQSPFDDSEKDNNQCAIRRNLEIVTAPPIKEQNVIRDILIGLFVTVVGGLHLWWINKKLG